MTTPIAEPSTSLPVPLCPPADETRTTTQRILVAWFRYTVDGGINRFLNVARVLHRFGHEVCFMSLSEDTVPDWPSFPGHIYTLDGALQSNWDAVMVPGAGAPRELLPQLAALKDPRCGLRVQHILSDASAMDGFVAVNQAFEPDIVLINNSQWNSRDFRPLSAQAFHVLPGAVDTDLFYPAALKSAPCRTSHWSIGAYADPHHAQILDVAELLPANHVVHLFGQVAPELAARAAQLEELGRIKSHGRLCGTELADFYRRMDVFVAAQGRAGWCNPAAEAMACGVPCVVTRHGTVDFARHLDNALVVDAPDAILVAAAIRVICDDPELHARLAQSAATTMRQWTWPSYSERLLALLQAPLIPSYYRIPELGLYGKWEPEMRTLGLESLLFGAAGHQVLDLGAAEGVVGWLFRKRGASLVHGFELDPARVRFANENLALDAGGAVEFRQGDLTDWDQFTARHADLLLDTYDVVLFLGVYHHLPPTARRQVLLGAAARSRRWLALRTGAALIEADGVMETLAAAGFRLVRETAGDPAENLGWLGIFERTGTTADHTAAPDHD